MLILYRNKIYNRAAAELNGRNKHTKFIIRMKVLIPYVKNALTFFLLPKLNRYAIIYFESVISSDSV